MTTAEEISLAKPETRPQPPGPAVYQIAIGHFDSRSLYLAMKLRLADLLANGPRDVSDLAKTTQAHAPSVNMMRFLASLGIFEELNGSKFVVSRVGGTCCT
jgi:hypothetical protein